MNAKYDFCVFVLDYYHLHRKRHGNAMRGFGFQIFANDLGAPPRRFNAIRQR